MTLNNTTELHPKFQEFFAREALFRHVCDVHEDGVLQALGFDSYGELFDTIIENGYDYEQFESVIPICSGTEGMMRETGDDFEEILQQEYDLLQQFYFDCVKLQKEIDGGN